MCFYRSMANIDLTASSDDEAHLVASALKETEQNIDTQHFDCQDTGFRENKVRASAPASTVKPQALKDPNNHVLLNTQNTSLRASTRSRSTGSPDKKLDDLDGDESSKHRAALNGTSDNTPQEKLLAPKDSNVLFQNGSLKGSRLEPIYLTDEDTSPEIPSIGKQSVASTKSLTNDRKSSTPSSSFIKSKTALNHTRTNGTAMTPGPNQDLHELSSRSSTPAKRKKPVQVARKSAISDHMLRSRNGSSSRHSSLTNGILDKPTNAFSANSFSDTRTSTPTDFNAPRVNGVSRPDYQQTTDEMLPVSNGQQPLSMQVTALSGHVLQPSTTEQEVQKTSSLLLNENNALGDSTDVAMPDIDESLEAHVDHSGVASLGAFKNINTKSIPNLESNPSPKSEYSDAPAVTSISSEEFENLLRFYLAKLRIDHEYHVKVRTTLVMSVKLINHPKSQDYLKQEEGTRHVPHLFP